MSYSLLHSEQTHMSFLFFSTPDLFPILNYLLLFHCYGLLVFLFWYGQLKSSSNSSLLSKDLNLFVMSMVLPVTQWVFLVLSFCREDFSLFCWDPMPRFLQNLGNTKCQQTFGTFIQIAIGSWHIFQNNFWVFWLNSCSPKSGYNDFIFCSPY